MQTTFGIIMLALVDRRPQVVNLKQMLEEFIKFRREVVTRRTRYDLARAEERAHILAGPAQGGRAARPGDPAHPRRPRTPTPPATP